MQNEKVEPLFSSDFTSIFALGAGYNSSTIELLKAKPNPKGKKCVQFVCFKKKINK